MASSKVALQLFQLGDMSFGTWQANSLFTRLLLEALSQNIDITQTNIALQILQTTLYNHATIPPNSPGLPRSHRIISCDPCPGRYDREKVVPKLFTCTLRFHARLSNLSATTTDAERSTPKNPHAKPFAWTVTV